jgi:hypothetical protein
MSAPYEEGLIAQSGRHLVHLLADVLAIGFDCPMGVAGRGKEGGRKEGSVVLR